jgi:hypothetical protein
MTITDKGLSDDKNHWADKENEGNDGEEEEIQ